MHTQAYVIDLMSVAVLKAVRLTQELWVCVRRREGDKRSTCVVFPT
jgi:hypothetical protein